MPTWESSASIDTFLEYDIQIFHFRVNFLLQLALFKHDTELPNLETCAYVDIKILRNKFKHWFQIGQAVIVHTLKVVSM